MSDTKPYTNLTKTDRPESSEVEFEVEIPYETLAPYRDAVIAKGRETVEVDGFRKGNAPEHVVVERLGEENILFEAAEKALGAAYPQILKDENIDALGRPSVTVTKLAANNPVGFKITTAVAPQVTLPDYKALAGAVAKDPEETAAEVEEKEVDEVVEQIKKSRAQSEQQKDGESEQGGGTTLYDASGNPIHKQDEQREVLPELTDEFVKTLGDFNDVADFRAKLAENMKLEKQQRAREKRRAEIAEKVIAEATLTLPAAIIEHELDKMLAQFKQDVERMGTSYEDYMKQLGKSEEDMRGEWRDSAEKRGKLQLILNETAKKENLLPEEQKVEEETARLKEHYPDADEAAVKTYVRTMLANEKVFEMLEKSGA